MLKVDINCLVPRLVRYAVRRSRDLGFFGELSRIDRWTLNSWSLFIVPCQVLQRSSDLRRWQLPSWKHKVLFWHIFEWFSHSCQDEREGRLGRSERYALVPQEHRAHGNGKVVDGESRRWCLFDPREWHGERSLCSLHHVSWWSRGIYLFPWQTTQTSAL